MSARLARTLVVLLALGAQAVAAVEASFAYELSADVAAVDLGDAFELRVLRRWPDDHDAVPFDPSSLAPLQVSVAHDEESRVDDHVEQRVVLRARAFRPEPVRLDGLRFTVRARDGSDAREVQAEPFELLVHSVLPADDAGALEWPEPLSRAPTHWMTWGLLGLVLVALVGSAWRARRARRKDDPAPAAETAAQRARERWQALTALDVDDPEQAAALGERAHAILRGVSASVLSVRERERTTPELLGDVASTGLLDDEPRAALARALHIGDLTRFAARTARGEARRQLLADGEAVLTALDAVERAQRDEVGAS